MVSRFFFGVCLLGVSRVGASMIRRGNREENPAFFEALAPEESRFDESGTMAVFDMRNASVGDSPDVLTALETVIMQYKNSRSALIARRRRFNTAPSRRSEADKNAIRMMLSYYRLVDPTVTIASAIAASIGEMNREIERIDTCIEMAGMIIGEVDLSLEAVNDCAEILNALQLPEDTDDDDDDMLGWMR